MSWQDYLLFRQLPHTRQLRSYNAFASEPRILFSLKDIISSHNLDKKINKSILTVILENTDATVKFQHYEINSRKQLSAEKQQIPQMKFIWTSVLKFKTLFPVLQNFYELLSPGWGLFGLLFSFITLTFFFFLQDCGKGEIKPSPFFIFEKPEVSNQYIFQFNLGSTDWSCSSKLNKVQQNFKSSHSTTKNLKPVSTH